MIQQAVCIGELVSALAAGRAEGRVRRIFRTSAYLEAGGDLILLMRGGLRSPMTINVDAGGDLRKALSIGDRFDLDRDRLRFEALEVRLDRAGVYRTGLRDRQTFAPIAEPDIVKAATALKLLYSVSDSSLDFVEGKALGGFVKSVLLPLALGRLAQVYETSNYLGLIGTGTGFTPAGDDFVAGFAASFNHWAGQTGARRVALPAAELAGRTVSESASLIDYAQRGYVDEGLERLILAAFGNRPQAFIDQVVELAKRGHTSGLDMSLGALLSLAAIRDREKHGGALESSLAAIGSS